MNELTGIPANFEKGPDFRRAVSQFQTDFLYFDIDLSVAQSNVIYDVNGDYLYIDPDPTGAMAAGGVSVAGFAVIELNNQQNAPSAPFFAQSGFALNGLFNQLKMSWPAQAGKKLRVMYSTGQRVVPSNSSVVTGSVSISGGSVAVSNFGSQTAPGVFNREAPLQYGASYANNTVLAANTAVQMVAPGTNVNGVIVWDASFISTCAAGNGCSLLAKASAPATPIDGDVIVQSSFVAFTTVNPFSGGKLSRPILIAAGKGLYWISSALESGGANQRSALYTVL